MAVQVRRLRLLWGVLAVALCACHPNQPLPKLGKAPAFSLRDQTAAERTADDLRGKVWIASFIFTRCPDICPLLTAKMVKMRAQLAAERADVRLVSFSVDPEHDTPDVLAHFAQEQHAAHDDWLFLTGPLDEVERVITQGFKQSLSREPGESGKPANILHGSHFVLVDRQLQMRGFYRSDDDGMARLVRDARLLVHGKADG